MGNLIFHEWARLIALTAGVYAVWGGYWGLFYRKFFWDFVGGTLRDPGGMQAPNSAAIFVTLIIKAPILQIFTIGMGFFLLAIEWPLPLLKNTMFYRSLIMRPVLLVMLALNSIFFYQGTNVTVYSLVAAIVYTRAIMKGEEREEAKDNRGRASAA